MRLYSLVLVVAALVGCHEASSNRSTPPAATASAASKASGPPAASAPRGLGLGRARPAGSTASALTAPTPTAPTPTAPTPTAPTPTAPAPKAPGSSTAAAKTSPATTPAVNRISKAKLAELFETIRRDMKLNPNGDLSWGYYFTDTDRGLLEQAGKKLAAQGYRYDKVFQADNPDAPRPYFYLHVEKVEAHSVDSLYDRNTELEAFAKQNGLDTYDGMDVAPVKTAGDKAK